MGIVVIRGRQLGFEATETHSGLDKAPTWKRGLGSVQQPVKLMAVSITTIPIQVVMEAGMIPMKGTQFVANVGLNHNRCHRRTVFGRNGLERDRTPSDNELCTR